MSNPSQVFPPPYSYVSNSNVGKEISIRDEFLSTIFGSSKEIAKSYRCLLRRMKLTSSGKPEKCPCVDRITNEQDRDYYCPVCMGERYIWSEQLINVYKVQHVDDNSMSSEKTGNVNMNFAVFYLPYNIDVNLQDKIIEIRLDVEGEIVNPIKRAQIWQLTEVVNLRLDTGRLEFIKLFARIEDVRYLNKP